MNNVDLAPRNTVAAVFFLLVVACGDDASSSAGGGGAADGAGGGGAGGDVSTGDATSTGGSGSGDGGAAAIPTLSCAAVDLEGLPAIAPQVFERAPEELPVGGAIRPGRYELDAVEVYLQPGESSELPAVRTVWELTPTESRQSGDVTNDQGVLELGYVRTTYTTDGPNMLHTIACSSFYSLPEAEFAYTATDDAFTTFVGEYASVDQRVIRRYVRR